MENIDKNVEEVMTSIRTNEAKIAEMEKRFATYENKMNAQGESKWAEVIDALQNKRAITLNGSQNIAVIRELFKHKDPRRPLLGMVRKFYGPNGQTNIPVWNPSVAVPSSYAEGVTNVSSDTTAVLGATQITPKAYISVLPVSNETLKMSAADLEAELPAIFSEAFEKAIEKGIVEGATTANIVGVFKQTITGDHLTTTAGLSGLAELALNAQACLDAPVIVMSPSKYSSLLANATVDDGIYKEELIRTKSIEGVRIILSSYVTATDYDAVCFDTAEYALGIADELEITPIKKVGDNNTYFQAVAYFGGKPLATGNIFAMKVTE